MDARVRSVSDILHEKSQYVVPLFQRSYSWHKDHWRRLNEDMSALADNSDRQVHFMGPLVSTKGNSSPGTMPVYQLIDGQQRLTTLTIVLAAIRDVANDLGFPELAEEITEDYLLHKRMEGTERLKVLPRLGDREALAAIIERGDLKPHANRRIVHAWRYFRRQFQHQARSEPRAALRKIFGIILQKLSFVVIAIDGENPYEIFESLNATGLPLAESDLIRNYVFMSVAINNQDAFDRNHWHPLEKNFASWGENRAKVMTAFYRDYLMREGQYSRDRNTFVDFKQQHQQRRLTAIEQADELLHYAPIAVQIRRPVTCPSTTIRAHLHEIERMDIGTSHPLIVNLLDRHACCTLSEKELCACLNHLVSFALRRTICGESTRAYGRWFVEGIKALGDNPADDLSEYLLQRGWPDDASFSRALNDFQIYKRESQKTRLLLEVVERQIEHKEQVVLDKLSIEHVMPQSITDDEAGTHWKQALGSDWKELHEQYLHVLGNLTLTGYNPELGKMSFVDKQTVYHDSNLKLNRYFRKVKTWNDKTIIKRTGYLAEVLCAKWPRPVSGDVYVPDEDDKGVKNGGSSAKQRNCLYWAMLLKNWPPHLDLPAPKPSESNELVIPLDITGDVSVHLWQYRRERKVVAYVRFQGRAARKIYERLLAKKGEVDDAIAGDLAWDWPVRNSFSVFQDDADFADRSDWEIQHAWFVEELNDIVISIRPELDALVERTTAKDEDTKGERRRLRHEFWTEHLAYAKTKTDIHANRTADTSNWVGGGIGRSGFHLNYTVGKFLSRAELYIDLKSKESNQSVFESLQKQKGTIEKEFGSSLDWQPLPESRACRICAHVDGGWRSPKESWPETHEKLVDAMIRLDIVFRHRVHSMNL